MATEQEIIHYYETCDIDYRLVWWTDKTFSLHYGYYDANNTGHNDAVLNTNRILATKAGIKPNDQVLDAGCGIGGSCVWLANNIGAQVTGINITAYQLQKAQRIVRKQGIEDKVRFEKMSFLDTSFDDNTFDVVWGMESVCYAENKEEFLTEAFRILKPGGRVAVADGFINDYEPKPAYHAMTKSWLDGWAVPNLWGQKQFIESLKNVGFVNIDFTDASRNIIPSARRMYKVASMFKLIAKILEFFKLRNVAQSGNFRAAEYQYPLLLEDVWRYGLVVAEKPPAA
ncbi:MAG: methyltransferase domain-containing protein [Pseudomonadales bacterium]|nr:methyltransferase domain-containing protein [Pseudomonadales bacterium]